MSTEIIKAADLPLAKMIVAKEDSIRAIARTGKAEAVIKSALLAINTDTNLSACSYTSVIACIMGAARMGLEVSSQFAGRGYIYLIPRGKNCTLQIGYRGLIEMVSRSSRFRSVRAEVIRRGDDFKYRPADDQPIQHEPAWQASNKQDNIIGVWAMATLASGEKVAVVLNTDDLKTISTSSYVNGDYFKKHYAEWCRARAIKRLCKLLPLDGDSQPTYSTPDEADDTLAVTETEVVETQAVASRAIPKYEGPDDDQDAPATTPEEAEEFAKLAGGGK
jgi:recombination protein RecT